MNSDETLAAFENEETPPRGRKGKQMSDKDRPFHYHVGPCPDETEGEYRRRICGELAAEIKDKDSEIARLREALENILENQITGSDAYETARAALRGDKS